MPKIPPLVIRLLLRGTFQLFNRWIVQPN
jgi:hypothetical protein